MADDLGKLLIRAEHLLDGVLTPQDARAWSRERIEGFDALGVITPDGHAQEIVYDGCEHDCTVVNSGFQKHPDDAARSICVQRCLNGCGRVILEAQDFQQWRFSLLGLAEAVRSAINASGEVIEDVPGRVWLVGAASVAGRVGEVFLGYGLARPDAAGVVASATRLAAAEYPVVLSVGVKPGNIWSTGKQPMAAVLAEHARLGSEGLVLDLAAVFPASGMNDRVRIVVAVFRWGVTQEIVPASVADALGMLDPLKRGRSRAKEGKKVGPVPEFLLESTVPRLPSPVRAMVRLQLLTGARPGEVVGLRGCDIDRDGRTGLLVARLTEHKTAHLGAGRDVYFGPEAEAVLEPFLRDRDPGLPLFSPSEAESERRARQHADRKTPIGYGNRPGTNRVDAPERAPGDAYTVSSYRRAIQYACDRAFPPPEHLRPRQNDGGRRPLREQFRGAWPAWPIKQNQPAFAGRLKAPRSEPFQTGRSDVAGRLGPRGVFNRRCRRIPAPTLRFETGTPQHGFGRKIAAPDGRQDSFSLPAAGSRGARRSGPAGDVPAVRTSAG